MGRRRGVRRATVLFAGLLAASAPAPAADARAVVLCIGTSLTAGFGVDPTDAYPAGLQERIDAAGLAFRVVNAGVSGETSAAALRRLDWLLRQPVAVVVLETGANDGLRGQDPDATKRNIGAIVERLRREEPAPRIVLVGMQTLTNYGPEYTARFHAIFPELAREYGLPLVPFLLEGVAGVPALNQADGIHPTPEGHERMADTVWSMLEGVLRTP